MGFVVSPFTVIRDTKDTNILTYLYDEHLAEARKDFNDRNILFIALQGSQNYGLDTPSSDIDTKLIITPTLNDLIFNNKAVSTTHVRENEEHIDYKDVRLIASTFRKQNMNFVEILFSNYCYINEDYLDELYEMFEKREVIARYSVYRAVTTMKGIAGEKHFAMEHRYPRKIDIIDRYGYDGKQLSHLVRIEEFLNRYLAGEPYADCLISQQPALLKMLKRHELPLEQARVLSRNTYDRICKVTDNYRNTHKEDRNEEAEEILNRMQETVMRKAITMEMREPVS